MPARSRRRRLWLVAVALLLVVTLPVSVSYGQALTAPGEASLMSRTVDWGRDHGAAPLINAVENWYYTRFPPSDQPPPSLPAADPGAAKGASGGVDRGGPSPLHSTGATAAVPGEAQWRPGRLDRLGLPMLYTGFVRPDPAHASVVAAVVWARQADLTAHLVAGTVQPGGSGWPGDGAVPPAEVSQLVATFNSGWRMGDIDGGFMIDGRINRPLRAGDATAAIDQQGQIHVGSWGTDLDPTAHWKAARQNLHLIVDRGAIAADLAANTQGLWGSPRNQYQFTDRSALGVDAAGNLIYVAGRGLTLNSLAAALVDAHAVRGMELDIHRGYTFFASWAPAADGSITPTKLLPTMNRPADRYLQPDQRDFFYLTSRP